MKRRVGVCVSFCCLMAVAAMGQTISMEPVPTGSARAHFRAYAPWLPPDVKSPIEITTPIGLTPAQVKRLYGFDRLTNSGSGQTIAIVDAFDDPSIEADMGVFNAQFGLPACTTANGCLQKVYVRENGKISNAAPRANPGWALEIALDVEWAHAIAPAAKIILLEAQSNSFTALFNAVVAGIGLKPDIISMSWGALEFSQEAELDPLFEVPGIAFVASTGDNGSGVQYPAASPYVLAVGGTTMQTNPSADYLGEIAWSGSGGGISQYEPPSPAQSSYGTSRDQDHRTVPDVAYLGDPITGVAVYDSQIYNKVYGWWQVGGTSAGAPQWAGLVAIVNSVRASAQKSPLSDNLGGVAQAMYAAAQASIPLIGPQFFRDVTIGVNGICGSTCFASSGYDYVTGWGSPNTPPLLDFVKRY